MAAKDEYIETEERLYKSVVNAHKYARSSKGRHAVFFDKEPIGNGWWWTSADGLNYCFEPQNAPPGVGIFVVDVFEYGRHRFNTWKVVKHGQ